MRLAPPEHEPASQAPRAFAQGTGLVLQSVGLVLFLSTCCVCGFAGQWDPVPSHGQILEGYRHAPPQSWSLGNLAEHPSRAGMMLMAMFMTIGGLAMLVFGLGMQSLKRGAALGALVTVTASLVIVAVAGVGLWVGGGAWVARAWHAVVLLVTIGLLPLTAVAWKQMRSNPPPADLYVLPADFDEAAYKRSIRGVKEPEPEDLAARRQRLEAELRQVERLERERGEQRTGNQ